MSSFVKVWPKDSIVFIVIVDKREFLISSYTFMVIDLYMVPVW